MRGVASVRSPRVGIAPALSLTKSYSSVFMTDPHAASIAATELGDRIDFQPPAFAVRTKGLSWRVFLVSTQSAPCCFRDLAYAPANLDRPLSAVSPDRYQPPGTNTPVRSQRRASSRCGSSWILSLRRNTKSGRFWRSRSHLKTWSSQDPHLVSNSAVDEPGDEVVHRVTVRNISRFDVVVIKRYRDVAGIAHDVNDTGIVGLETFVAFQMRGRGNRRMRWSGLK